MIIDMVELPTRYDYCDECLITTLPHFLNNSSEDINWYGRKIPVDLFVNDKVKKYKTIEAINNDTIERIFLISDKIDTNKQFWTSNQRVYPIQGKFFNINDPMIGTTIKYVNGIKEFNEEFFNEKLTPVVFKEANKSVLSDPCLFNSPYHVVIPSLDIRLVDNNAEDVNYPKIPIYDSWLDRENKLSNITKMVDQQFNCHPAEAILDKDKLFEISEELYNTCPIEQSWAMYELISQLNDLAVSDIRIEANGYTGKIDVSFGSRYSKLSDYSHVSGYNELKTKLIRLTENMLRDRFKETAWTRVIIEKYWTEEIYMSVNVQCPGRSKSIETFYYIDLVLFSLGTVGLI